MADVTVAQFAEVLKVPVDRLLQQLDQAGIKVDSAEDMISEDAKHELLTQAIASEESMDGAEPGADLIEITGEPLGKTLARKGVRTRDDLADLAVDELVEIGSIDEKKAGELIMNARKHWFAEEAKV